ncbi:MAG: DNA repair protein RadC [Peptostreptococcaceae bacterium]|nr:DNA repair protein RadC [Peptostreptococcaceae bacterium]
MEYEYKIKNLSEEERPIEILLKKGEKALTNAQLLAILLNTGTRNKSAIVLASELLSAQNGVKNLNGLSVEELSKFKGIGKTKACRIIAALELGVRISVEKGLESFCISSSSDAGNIYMEELRYRKKEIFRVIFLNTKNMIIAHRDISEGSLNASIVHPREVFIEAIRKNSNKIIVMHNHPSGDPQPSREDFSITERLVQAGRIIGIEVLDHIIIGDGVYYSFRENAKL